MRAGSLEDLAKRFSMAVIAREVLADVVTILQPLGIDVMPLKGVLLQPLVYGDGLERTLKDVDVAVRLRDFELARHALVQAGYAVVREEGGGYEVALRSTRFPLSVDLHRAFAAARRCRLNPDAMFGRGRRDNALYGFPVVLPDDYDLYAHLLAHSVLDFVAGAGWHWPGDLRRVRCARRLRPADCARRLDEHGLGRFARVALAPGTPMGEDPASSAVISALRFDPVGEAIARLARAVYRRRRSPDLLRRAIAVLLNPTLVDAGIAVAEAAIARLHQGVLDG